MVVALVPHAPGPNVLAADSPEVLARVHAGFELVDIVARQLRRQLSWSLEFDELTSAGREGLLSAARHFDPARGVPFRAWATLRIRGAMVDSMRAHGALPRRIHAQLRALEAADRVQAALTDDFSAAPVANSDQANDRLGGYLAAMATAMATGLVATGHEAGPSEPVDDEASPEQLSAERELATAIRAAIATLPETERRLVEHHYFDELTLDQAAQALGLSKSWASRLHARAMESVARSLRRARISP